MQLVQLVNIQDAMQAEFEEFFLAIYPLLSTLCHIRSWAYMAKKMRTKLQCSR